MCVILAFMNISKIRKEEKTELVFWAKHTPWRKTDFERLDNRSKFRDQSSSPILVTSNWLINIPYNCVYFPQGSFNHR